jgi:hypothetical protein
MNENKRKSTTYTLNRVGGFCFVRGYYTSIVSIAEIQPSENNLKGGETIPLNTIIRQGILTIPDRT